MTLKDIARRIGVSHATVSLALKDDPRISEKRRKEVQRIAKRLGYRPDPMLSSLIAYRIRNRALPVQSALAWLNHWENPKELRRHIEFDNYWKGASETAERLGYRLDEFVWEEGMTGRRLETIFRTRSIRGILVPPHPLNPDWGNFRWDRFAVIRFGQAVRLPDCSVVTSDQLSATVLALEKIRDRGYRRIGLAVAEDFDFYMRGSYTNGYSLGQRLLGLEYRLPALLLPTQEAAGTVEPLRRWLAEHRPEAILTPSPGVIEALKILGLRIPEDIAVAGTSVVDLPVDAGTDQNSREIGRVAVESLVAIINGHSGSQPAPLRRILVQA
ncbi:MAG TPA: LacI family DNA-binding transcriptional regulator, partial [Candidatus Methylacidiphilales bacterium]